MPDATRAADADRVGPLLSEAHAHFAEGRTAEARGLLEEALRLSGGDSDRSREVRGDLAVVAVTEGRFDDAVALAEPVAEADPAHAAAAEVLEHCRQVREQLAAAAAYSGELQAERVAQFQRLSTCMRVHGEPIRTQAVQLVGDGRISFGRHVRFGWPISPDFYSGYAYLEARHRDTHVEIGDDCIFNNTPVLIGEGPGISIGARSIFGPQVHILDTDFHDLHPARRHGGTIATDQVTIGCNVFLGSKVVVTKGVTIGDDTVVGAASVVTKSLPAGVIAAGNPARVIRELLP